MSPYCREYIKHRSKSDAKKLDSGKQIEGHVCEFCKLEF